MLASEVFAGCARRAKRRCSRRQSARRFFAAKPTAPILWAKIRKMYRALRQAGVKVEMLQYPREDHSPQARGFFGFPSQEPRHGFDARPRMLTFINTALGKK